MADEGPREAAQTPAEAASAAPVRLPPVEGPVPHLRQPELIEQPLITRTPLSVAPLPQTEPRLSQPAARRQSDLPPATVTEPPLKLAPATAVPAAPVATWQEPKTLLDGLARLGSEGPAGRWAQETARAVRELGPAMKRSPEAGEKVLKRLGELVGEAGTLATTLRDRSAAHHLGQAGHALKRRLEVWKEVAALGPAAAPDAELPSADFARLSQCIDQLDSLTTASPEGKAWREYLLLDTLRQNIERGRDLQERFPRNVAQVALKRLTQSPLSADQRQFLAREPVATLEAELRRLAAEPIDRAALLQHVEQYEQTRLPADAHALARDCQSLEVSASPQSRELGRQIDTHYRNANLRLAISEQLLNRLMPKQNLEYSPVRDTVMGMPVHGQSVTSSEVAVRMMPDPNHVRLALEISGEVASLTSSASGPARFVNKNNATYVARKPVEIDLRGIHLQPAEVQVDNDMRLRELETDFDGIPLVGALAKGIARSQHEQNRPAANQEIKRKVAWKARQRIDTEAGERLGKASHRLREEVLEPLYALSLDPTIISAETSDQRFVMRLRLAGEDQLGSHTPRPQAPSDSLASFQIHETMLNNILGRLELEGKTFTLPQLAQHFARRLSRAETAEISPDQEDIAVTFADRNPLEVRCQDGQVVFTVSLARLSKPPRSWKNFQARAFYRPDINGRIVELGRDGVIHLIGQRLDFGSQIVLRGVFSRAFPKKMPWCLTPERLANDPALADLTISQCTIDDGWIGVALSSRRIALRPGLLRR